MKTVDHKFLCLPCAVELQKECQVRVGQSVREKGTCSRCQRRRFGYICTIEGGPPVKKKEMFVCTRCRGQLESRLEFREIPESGTAKQTCAYCGKRCYGAMYEIIDRLDKQH